VREGNHEAWVGLWRWLSRVWKNLREASGRWGGRGLEKVLGCCCCCYRRRGFRQHTCKSQNIHLNKASNDGYGGVVLESSNKTGWAEVPCSSGIIYYHRILELKLSKGLRTSKQREVVLSRSVLLGPPALYFPNISYLRSDGVTSAR
jgi:hypothetical protein